MVRCFLSTYFKRHIPRSEFGHRISYFQNFYVTSTLITKIICCQALVKKEILNKLNKSTYTFQPLLINSHSNNTHIRESNEKEQSDVTHYERGHD